MNPVMLTLGDFQLKYYTFFIIISVVVGLALIQSEGKRFGIKSDFTFNMCFWGLIFGLIGARLYYVIFNWEHYSVHLNEIIQIWNGGLAIHGGIIGGLLTILVYCKKYKVRMIRYLDFIVPALLIGQAIGRWGNFFNSEAHGAATTLASLQSGFIPNFVIEGMNIQGTYYIPTFYYESLACLLLFIVFLIVRRIKYTKVGTLTGLYLITYGIVRFFIEMSRTDALMLGGLRLAQVASIIMLLVGIVILMINARKSKFEDLYNDKNNVDKILF